MKYNEPKNITITLPKFGNVFIYFLIDKNEVVYVGQTKNGIARPLQHKDKIYDTVKFIYCEPKELTIKEDYYITKYKPKYNKTLSSFNYSLMKARNCLRLAFSTKDITIATVKKYIKQKNINLVEINSNLYITQNDMFNIYLDMKEQYDIQNKQN